MNHPNQPLNKRDLLVSDDTPELSRVSEHLYRKALLDNLAYRDLPDISDHGGVVGQALVNEQHPVFKTIKFPGPDH